MKKIETAPYAQRYSSGPIGETRLNMPQSTKVLLWLLGGVGGAAVGFALTPAGRLAEGHSFPNADLIESLASFGGPIMVVGRPVIFALLGLAVAFVISYQSPDLRITNEEITVTEGDDTRVIGRAQVGGVYRRKGKVVIESPQGRTLFDGEVEGGKDAIAAAFNAHHYPWESR